MVRRWLADDLLVLPDHEKLRRQLLAFEEKITPSGALTFGARGAGHDDYVALLLTAAMADAAGHLRGSPYGKRSINDAIADKQVGNKEIGRFREGVHRLAGKFLTAAEVDYLKHVGAGKTIEHLHGQFQDMLVNTFRNSKNVKVTREQYSPPAVPTRPNERELAQQNTCAKCSLVYAFDNDPKFCPQCNAAVV